MDLKFILLILSLSVLILIGISSFVRNFYGLLKKNNPTTNEISYVEGIACLIVILFMFWIILIHISIK